jgi:hypothetical protein
VGAGGEGQLDFHSCDTRIPGAGTFSPYACGVLSPDSSGSAFGFVPLLAPGDTFTAYYTISINAELEKYRVQDSVRAFNRLLYSVTDLLSDKCQVQMPSHSHHQQGG